MFSLTNIFAQENEIKDKNWVNTKIIINSKETITPILTPYFETNLFINTENKLITGLCGHSILLHVNSYSQNILSTNFESETLMECPPYPYSGYSEFEDLYFKFWNNSGNGTMQDLGPYNYTISKNNDGSESLILKNKNGDEAFFNYSKLRLNDITKSKILIYPNPIENEININIENKNQVNVKIYNLDGKLLLSKPIETKNAKISTSNLKKGIYIIEISENNKIIKTEKMIKK